MPGPAPFRSDLESAAGYLLETPSIRRYHLTVSGENASGADNQQERPGFAKLDCRLLIEAIQLMTEYSSRNLESSEAIRQPPPYDM